MIAATEAAGEVTRAGRPDTCTVIAKPAEVCFVRDKVSGKGSGASAFIHGEYQRDHGAGLPLLHQGANW